MPPKQKCNAWTTTLHALINEESDDEWKSVMERLRSHPQEAGVKGQHHLMTPLHCACLRYPPDEAVAALLSVCPDSAASQNSEGETALHLAVEGASDGSQIKILQACTNSLMMRDKYGDTPCHRACALGSSIEILEEFVAAKPEVVNVENNDGVTPFYMLSTRYSEAKSLSDLSEEGDFYDDWEKTMIFLKAPYSSSSSKANKQKFNVLQAAAAAKCSRVLLQTCVRLFPSELLSQDEKGRVPLSIAAMTENFEIPQVTPDSYADIPQEKTKKSAVKILLEAEKKAASIPDDEGRYPLFYAIESGKEWDDINDILMAHPVCIYKKDPESHLFPFMSAASKKKSSLTTIYSLLRAFPVLVQTGIPEDMKRRRNEETNSPHKKMIQIDLLSNAKKVRLN